MVFDWRTGLNRYRYYLGDLRKIGQRKDISLWTSFILTFFTIAFFGFFAIRPTLIIIAELTRDIKDKEELNTQLKKKISSLVAAQAEYSANQERFYLVNQALPQFADFSSLLYGLEKEVSFSGVKILSFSVGKINIFGEERKKTTQKVPSFEFQVSLEGDYPNLLNFLKSVENFRESISLNLVSFNKAKKTSEEEPKLILTISGEMNFFPKGRGEKL